MRLLPKSPGYVLFVLLATVLALAIGGCARGGPESEPAESPRGLVVVTLQGWWSGDRPGDPFPPSVSEGAVVFRDVVTPCLQVRPAVASVLTGSAPDRLGVRDDFFTPLPHGVPTIAEILGEQGWTTAAFVSDPRLASGSGLDRGIELFDGSTSALIGPERHAPPIRPAEEILANFGLWRDSLEPGRSAFAWLHIATDPLADARAELRGERREGAEAGEADEAPEALALRESLDRVVEILRGDDDRSWGWIVAGTEGQVDSTHGERSGYFLGAEVLRVPLLYRSARPDSSAEAVASPAWLPDVFALAMREAGIERPAPDAVLPWEAGRDRVRYAWGWQRAEEFGWPSEAAAVREDALVIVEGERPHRWLSWTGGQPRETEDAELAAQLRARTASEPAAAPVIPDEILAALGDAGVSIPARAEPPALAPRRARIDGLDWIAKARRAAATSRDLADAITRYNTAAEADPSNLAALVEPGELFAWRGRRRRAKAKLEAALGRNPHHAEAWHWLGHVAYLEGEMNKAEAIWRLTDLLQPNSPDVLYDLACTHSLRGDVEGAERYLRRAWDAGFRNVNQIQQDRDLRNLRADPRFGRFMASVVR